MAEKLLKENRENFIALREKIRSWKATKKYSRMTHIYGLAIAHKEAKPQVLILLRESIFDSLGEKSGNASRKGAVEVWRESSILRWC